MTAEELALLGAQVWERWPRATLVKNQVGNLNVYDGDEWVAWLDLRYGTIEEVE